GEVEEEMEEGEVEEEMEEGEVEEEEPLLDIPESKIEELEEEGKPKTYGGICSRCANIGLNLYDDGHGECPKCGYSFSWNKKD
ncbi:MAG: hypothetical protein R6U17_04755, partial [Thermoplasmata archaeon]